jgi:hypothetical protein
MKLAGVVFYLDAPVSNAGRLKTRIYEILYGNKYGISVELTNNVDAILKDKAYVVTSDAIILNECVSWINLTESIITGNISGAKCIDLGS